MSIFSAAITLILVMDPLGNIPIFLSILNTVEAAKRNRIVLRETFIAFLILTIFLFSGKTLLHGLHISEPALGIAGGIVLFLISIKMIFPPEGGSWTRERQVGEPFIVPLAIPLIAGPSALTTVLLLGSQKPHNYWHVFLALFIASTVCALILLFASHLRRVLGQKALVAIERLMGMLLTTMSVQMFLTGVEQYFKLK